MAEVISYGPRRVPAVRDIERMYRYSEEVTTER
jgi:hypothetical protein